MNDNPASSNTTLVVPLTTPESVGFPAHFAGMTQRAGGEIVLRLEIDASQLPALSVLGAEWLDRGLLVAITPAVDTPIAGD